MEETTLGGAKAFKVKTPQGEVTVNAAICEPLPNAASDSVVLRIQVCIHNAT